jgi:BolA protein
LQRERRRALSAATDRAIRIREILTRRFQPSHLELHDESDRHVGHAGATSGGGHFRAVIVSDEFEGKSLLERHRMVNDAMRELFGSEIHALALRTCAPSEWSPDS